MWLIWMNESTYGKLQIPGTKHESGNDVPFQRTHEVHWKMLSCVQDFWNYWMTIQTFGSPMWDAYCDESGMQ